MFGGGIADKAGNRFEARWLTRQLLGLINGKALSITVEKIGDGEEGFEFLVERPNFSEWHQCKRQTSDTAWTIAALGREGVIGNFGAKLALSSAQRCVFVSTDVVKQIKLLQEKRAVAPTLAEFESILSKDETKHWQVLLGQLRLGHREALDWLGRCEFLNLSEELLEQIVASEIAFWFKGEPDQIVSAIRSWVEEDRNFNRPIDRGAFLAFADAQKFALKQYEADQTLPGRIENATASYTASYGPLGAGLFAVARPETDSLVIALLGDAPAKTIVLVGPAGSGKSAVIRDAVARISDRHVAQLAFRVDQIGEPISLAQLGTAVIDVADSPAVVLERLSGDKPAILYIDQADAVSQMSGRSAQVRRQLVDLVNQASSYRNVRLVFSCRTFDIENDQLFTEIASRDDTLRIDVPTFDWERDVVPVLQQFEISINPDNPRIRALLAQPIGLSLAAQLARNGVKDLRNVENLSELFDRLLVERDQAIRERQKPAWSVYAALESIAAEMSNRQELVAPLHVLNPFAGAREILQQEGLIVVTGQKISLIHESLFDFLHARAFVGSGQSLIDFLVSSEQTLFRRTQVRQILAAERDLDFRRYSADLNTLFKDDRVRPHVRDLVLRWLGTVPQPSAVEWNALALFAAREGDGEVPRSIGRVIFDRPGWFKLLAETGIVSEWLNGSPEAQRWALAYLRSVADAHGEPVAMIVNAYLDKQPQQAGTVLDQLHWLSPKKPAPAIAEVLIRALGMIHDPAQLSRGGEMFELHASWVEHAPVDASRLLGASLEAWYRLIPEGMPFKPALENGTGAFYHLVELAKARPLEALQALLPAMRQAMTRMSGEDGPPYQDRVWYWRRRDRDEHASIEVLDVVRDALRQVAINQTGGVEPLFAMIDPANQITALHLMLETIAANGKALAPLLIAQVDHPALFKAGWEGAPAYSAAKAITAAWDWLPSEAKAKFERRVLRLWPEFDDAKWALSLRDSEQNSLNRTPQQIRVMALHYLRLSGLRQWSVLRLIGDERLSPTAANRLRFLARKFARAQPERPDGIRSGSVLSPIAPDRAAHMSDAAWLTAFARVGAEGGREWAGGGFRGGAYELGHVLQAKVKDDPERFLSLLEKVPADANPAFANAIAMGISESAPPPERTERLFELLEKGAPRPSDRTLIWLVRATNGEKGPRTLDFILQLASTGEVDSGVEQRVEGKNEKPQSDFRRAANLGSFLDSRAMNSARGAALQEIGALSWSSLEKFKQFGPVIDPFIGSDMPDFLHAAIAPILLAALKHDLEIASDWISRTAKASLTALFNGNGRRAVLWLDSKAPKIASPILEVLISSRDSLEQAIGALLVTQRSLEDDRWTPVVDQLIEVGPTQRAAIAEVAASYVADSTHADRATSWLVRFFDDEDEGVRTTALDCFRRINPERMAAHVRLYEAYVKSKYFNLERTYFLHQLGKASAGMDEIVLGLIEKVVAMAQGRKDDLGTSLYQIWDPLLRIYASCGDDTARLARCLDVIDDLVVLDVYDSGKLNALT
jgi:hypothetical protein